MNPHSHRAAALVAALLLLMHAAPPAQVAARAQRRTPPPREAIIFIVTKAAGAEAQVEPVAFVNKGGALVEPVLTGGAPNSGESAAEAPSGFFTQYYRPGAKYRLVFGGAEAGSVTIREAVRAECSPNAARVDISTTNAKLGGNVMALALVGAYPLRAQSSRRAPTEQERAASFNVAKSVLAQKRVSATAVERGTKTLNLTATDLDGDGREELVGSYVVRTGPQTRDTLFLVAAPRERGYRAALSKYARVNAGEMMDPSLIDNIGEGGLGTELFVEQLDVDGDGVGELFTMSQSFEGTTYRAYRRQRGVWRAAYENYSYRCAY